MPMCSATPISRLVTIIQSRAIRAGDRHLILHPLDQQILRRIRRRGPPQPQLLISLCQPVGHLEIKIQDESRHNHLDLVRSKEPSRTSARSVAKHEISFICCNEQISSLNGSVTFAAVAQLVMSEAVKFVRVGPEFRVLVDGVDRGFDDDAGGDVLAV
jgi:hypothetical protein